MSIFPIVPISCFNSFFFINFILIRIFIIFFLLPSLSFFVFLFHILHHFKFSVSPILHTHYGLRKTRLPHSFLKLLLHLLIRLSNQFLVIQFLTFLTNKLVAVRWIHHIWIIINFIFLYFIYFIQLLLFLLFVQFIFRQIYLYEINLLKIE